MLEYLCVSVLCNTRHICLISEEFQFFGFTFFVFLGGIVVVLCFLWFLFLGFLFLHFYLNHLARLSSIYTTSSMHINEMKEK